MLKPLVSASSSAPPLFLFLLLLFMLPFSIRSGDPETLLALKSSLDLSNSLPWPQRNEVCKWTGVKECLRGRVSKLVVEYQNLTGSLNGTILNQLEQLRVLSLKGNSLSGQIPDLSGLLNLKSLYLSDNNFSGDFPDSITSLHRIKIISLSGNRLSGTIPSSLLNVTRLYFLQLQDNSFYGKIPPLDQTSLRFFNVSNNQLSGEIPQTPPLIRFNLSSFSGNPNLCGQQIQTPCSSHINTPPLPPPSSPSSNPNPHSKLIRIIAGSVGGFLLLLLCGCCLFCICRKRNGSGPGSRAAGGRSKSVEFENVERGGSAGGAGGAGDGNGGGGGEGASGMGDNIIGRQGVFSWEKEGLGSLVFLGAGDQMMSYSLEDLLKASAETLGRGTMGSTYKAVMESGFIVTVKRLKDARYPRLEEFTRHMDILGRLTHPNLVPLRAYFQAKEERLLVYDYFPNGSLFSLLHGTRTSGGGKPLHWTSCLKIAEDLATGLLYIHQNPGLTHGNLKSSNVLLGPEFESCLTDYGLAVFRDPDSQEEPSATSLFYRSPESRDPRKPPTQPADVYSFGVLLLELLTGKTPFQDLVQEHGSDIPRWVRSVREEETESGDDPTSGNEAAEEKLQALVNISMACVSLVPENRPSIREVLKMVKDARAEAQVSSNSSDHSPGRWSDTVQSLPREEQLSI